MPPGNPSGYFLPNTMEESPSEGLSAEQIDLINRATLAAQARRAQQQRAMQPQMAQLDPQSMSDFAMPGEEVLPPQAPAQQQATPRPRTVTDAPLMPMTPGQQAMQQQIEAERAEIESYVPPEPELTNAPVDAGEAYQAEQLARDPSGQVITNAETSERSGITFTPGVGLQMQIPGAEGVSVLPPEIYANRDALHAYLASGIQRYMTEGRPLSFDPSAPSFDPGTAQAMIQELRRAAQQAAGMPQSNVRTTTGFSQTIGAPVSPETQMRQLMADQQLAQAQEGMDQADLGMLNAQGQSFGQAADVQGQMLAERQEADARRARELRMRMGQVDQAIQNVAANRINPEQFFGNFAGRLGATIAVALGEAGAALTGGPNRALEIINQGIERNIQSQMANQDNQRAAAGMQMNALNQFQSILGDESAAEEAARAAHWQMVLTQIDQFMTGARGDRMLAAQGLRDAVQQQLLASQQAAAERAQFSVSVESQQVQRGGPSPIRMAQAQVAEQQMAREARRQALREQDFQRSVEANTLNGEPMIGPADMTFTAEEIEAAEGQAQPAPQRRRGGGGQRPAPQQSRRRVLSDARATPTQLTQEDLSNLSVELGGNEAQGLTARLVQNAPRALPGGIDPGDWATLMQNTQSSEERTNLNRLISDMLTTDERFADIIRVRSEFGGELFNIEDGLNEARAAVEMTRGILQSEDFLRLGVVNSPAEQERLIRMLPDPDEITAINSVAGYDRVLSQYQAVYRDMMRVYRNRLITAGLSSSSVSARNRAAAVQRLIGRARQVREQGGLKVEPGQRGRPVRSRYQARQE